MNKGLFITGTDTAVGKTLITCGIARLLKDWGAKVGVMKPIATGDQDDARQLIEAAGVDDPIDLVNPQFFKEPLAPEVSAAMERRKVSLEAVYKAYWYLHKKYDILLVEGVGGVKVPLSESTYVVDVIQALGLPALVVSRATLGTLNHTLLTLDALERAKVPAAGVLLNGSHGRTLAEHTNADTLQNHTTTPVLGHLLHQRKYAQDPNAVSSAMKRMPKLTKAVRRACGLS